MTQRLQSPSTVKSSWGLHAWISATISRRYLQSLPFDTIKIDRTFLANLNQILNLPPIVRAIGPGRHPLPVVAERLQTETNSPFRHESL
jgi:predicted signal transduction protein with EAL and GGDEF domain